ncbi:MAG: alpha/beta hydrolase [Lewinellaceae bacterium]|nr:alpha/beta hydrolase [Lewinellaceae bacterium]
MNYEIQTEGKFNYIETRGGNENLMLLHGLFGALSNFESILDEFGKRFNVIVPILPIYELPIRKVSLSGLVDHVEDFVKFKKYKSVHVLGNSLGGHISLLYALANPKMVRSLILTGSSGLFENAMGSTFPRRGDYQFIKTKTESTFYDPKVATKELVDEVFDIVNDRNKAIRVLATAKSAIRHNVGDRLYTIKVPVLLIWGNQDDITPPFVAEKFAELIPNSRLYFVDKCGHAPMMEHPQLFNQYLNSFLENVTSKETTA